MILIIWVYKCNHKVLKRESFWELNERFNVKSLKRLIENQFKSWFKRLQSPFLNHIKIMIFFSSIPRISSFFSSKNFVAFSCSDDSLFLFFSRINQSIILEVTSWPFCVCVCVEDTWSNWGVEGEAGSLMSRGHN